MLKVGDIIEVSGFVMLKGVEGKLKVSSIDSISYSFTKVRGKRIVCRHYKSDIDSWLDSKSDINFISVV